MLVRLLEKCRLKKTRRRFRGEAGMVTAEYAVGAVAAVAFAYVLYRVVNSGAVTSALSAVIRKALDVQF